MSTLEAQNAIASAQKAPRARDRSSLASQVAWVGIGNLVIAAITILITRVYAQRYSQDEVSAYLIFRLYGSMIVAFGTLGMPIAVQRTVAFLASNSRRAGTAALLGLAIGLSALTVFSGALALFAHPIASYLKHPAAADLWVAMLAYTLAQAPATLLSFIELARFAVGQSIAVLFAGFALGPLVAIALLPRPSFPALLIWGALGSVVFILPWMVRTVLWARRSGFGDAAAESGVLLRYGLPRVVGTTTELMLDPAVPWIAVQNGLGLASAGFLAIGVSLLRPLSPVAGALNQVMVPRSATFAAEEDLAGQSRQMTSITEWSIHVGLFCTLQMAVWCDVLIRTWLGPQYLPAVPAARLIVLALAPWFIYLTSRGIIDGHSEKPVNTGNLLIALAVFLIAGLGSRWLGGGLRMVALSYVGARVLLASLTLGYGVRVLHLRVKGLRIPAALLASLVLAAAAWWVRQIIPLRFELAALLVFGPVAALLYAVFMISRGARWGAALMARLPFLATLRDGT